MSARFFIEIAQGKHGLANVFIMGVHSPSAFNALVPEFLEQNGSFDQFLGDDHCLGNQLGGLLSNEVDNPGRSTHAVLQFGLRSDGELVDQGLWVVGAYVNQQILQQVLDGLIGNVNARDYLRNHFHPRNDVDVLQIGSHFAPNALLVPVLENQSQQAQAVLESIPSLQSDRLQESPNRLENVFVSLQFRLL